MLVCKVLGLCLLALGLYFKKRLSCIKHNPCENIESNLIFIFFIYRVKFNSSTAISFWLAVCTLFQLSLLKCREVYFALETVFTRLQARLFRWKSKSVFLKLLKLCYEWFLQRFNRIINKSIQLRKLNQINWSLTAPIYKKLFVYVCKIAARVQVATRQQQCCLKVVQHISPSL